MSEDHNLSEENNSSEENPSSEEQVLQEKSDVSESSGTDDADKVTDEDTFESGDEDEDVFGGDDETDETEVVENQEEVTGEEEEIKIKEKPEKKIDDHKKWYSLRVISGKERKIKERIELEIVRGKWQDYVTQILVPSEKVYKIRNGKKVVLERNILPGYILVEADSTNFTGEMVNAIVNVPNVIHFLGRNNPIPMQASEANRMLGKVDESQSLGEAMMEPFIVGETVKIIDGPFNEFVGDIQEINEEKKKLKVVVKIFGRGTEVELNFMQVDKQ